MYYQNMLITKSKLRVSYNYILPEKCSEVSCPMNLVLTYDPLYYMIFIML